MEMEVIQSIQAAKKFLAKPVAWPKEDRLALLSRIKEVVAKNQNEWAAQEAQQQGLPEKFVLENGFKHVAKIVDNNLLALQNAEPKTILTPTGVIAIITAAPLSFRLVMESLVPALAAGNAVIIKVSSKSPVTKDLLFELSKLAEFPEGTMQILSGGGDQGAFLAAHPGVRGVSFVGKTKTAESIIKATASQFKKLHLRGSAKNSAIVLPGFDYSKMPELLESFLIQNTGWSMSRLLTTEAEAPNLIEKLKAALSDVRIKLNNPAEFQSLKKKAVEEHGRAILEAEDKPLFLENLPNCSDMQQEELSAPIFPVITVKYQHEFAKWVNNTSYGNLCTIWGDQEKALKVAEKIEAGAIWFNHWMRPQDESPWGLKQSSFGIPDNLATGSFYSDRKLTV
jgi:aminomuconate-semialdehyde/2-hydroxymuconate-6-semialdehyde dehydrogenase